MNINWQLSNESGRLIKTNGEVIGSGDNILLEVPHNIKIVLSVRPDYQVKITSAQINSLRRLLGSLKSGIIFSSNSPNLEELAISMYHGNGNRP